MDTDRTRRPLASVWTSRDPNKAWLVAETPAEVAELVADARRAGTPRHMRRFITLTLANPDRDVVHKWNGRPLYVDPRDIVAISPPLDASDDDEDED